MASQNIVETRTQEVTNYIEKLGLLNKYDPSSSKIGVADDGKLYSSWTWLSSIERTYYGQSREITINHISDEIKKATELYNNILDDIQKNDGEIKNSLGVLASSFKEQLVLWQAGINTFLEIYSGDDIILEKIQTIDKLITETVNRQLFELPKDAYFGYDGGIY